MWCNHTCAISNRFSHWNCCDASLSTDRCAASIAQHAWCADHHTCNSSDAAPTIFLLFSFRAKRRRRSATGEGANGGTATRRGTMIQYIMGLRRYYYTLHLCDVLQCWCGGVEVCIHGYNFTAGPLIEGVFSTGFVMVSPLVSQNTSDFLRNLKVFAEIAQFLKEFTGFCWATTVPRRGAELRQSE